MCITHEEFIHPWERPTFNRRMGFANFSGWAGRYPFWSCGETRIARISHFPLRLLRRAVIKISVYRLSIPLQWGAFPSPCVHTSLTSLRPWSITFPLFKPTRPYPSIFPLRRQEPVGQLTATIERDIRRFLGREWVIISWFFRTSSFFFNLLILLRRKKSIDSPLYVLCSGCHIREYTWRSSPLNRKTQRLSVRTLLFAPSMVLLPTSSFRTLNGPRFSSSFALLHFLVLISHIFSFSIPRSRISCAEPTLARDCTDRPALGVGGKSAHVTPEQGELETGEPDLDAGRADGDGGYRNVSPSEYARLAKSFHPHSFGSSSGMGEYHPARWQKIASSFVDQPVFSVLNPRVIGDQYLVDRILVGTQRRRQNAKV